MFDVNQIITLDQLDADHLNLLAEVILDHQFYNSHSRSIY